MDIEIRPIRADEFEAYARATDAAFSGVASPEELEDDRSVAELDRRFAALEDGTIVGGASAASYRMTVPGGHTVPTAGITHVGVLPTHRRRGVNTALMRAQLEDAHRRGEPLAALHASEGGIYRGFGFGMGTFIADLDVETSHSAFHSGYVPSGRVRLLARDEAMPRMRRIFDAAVPARPGMLAIDDRWFMWRFAEPTPDKESPTFYAVHETEQGEPDAYAVYKVKHDWPGEIPRNKLHVNELMATTPQATADIWRFVFDIDLVERVQATDRPADDPLLHLAVEPRHLGYSLRDGMYLRLVDVPAALEARAYAGRRHPRPRGLRHLLSVERGSLRAHRHRRVGDLSSDRRRAGPRVQCERARGRLSGRHHVRRARRVPPRARANRGSRGPCRHDVPVGAGALVLPAVLNASVGNATSPAVARSVVPRTTS